MLVLSKMNSLIEILINLIDHPLIVNSVIIPLPDAKEGIHSTAFCNRSWLRINNPRVMQIETDR